MLWHTNSHTKYRTVTVFLRFCKCRLYNAGCGGRISLYAAVTCPLNSVAAVAVMWTDSVYPVCSPTTGTTVISQEGSGPVIVMSSKALGGPHTHKERETAGTLKYNYIKLFDLSSLNTCYFLSTQIAACTEGHAYIYPHFHIQKLIS